MQGMERMPPKTAAELESQLREAHTYIGRISLFVAKHDMTDEWMAYHQRLRAQDAAERARSATRESE